METPSFKEDHISQIPALQMLLKKFKKIGSVKTQSELGREHYRTWFSGSSENKEIPRRAGYCVGLIIARKLANSGIQLSEMVGVPYLQVPIYLSNHLAD